MIAQYDPITVLLPSVRKWQGPWAVTKSYVMRVGQRGTGFAARGRGDTEVPRRYVDEGVTWIRGHHTRRSREGRAMLAAALVAL